MSRWLRLALAVGAFALTLVSIGAVPTSGTSTVGGSAHSVSAPSSGSVGSSCPLDTTRCTPVVPPGPSGPVAPAGVAFLVAGAGAVAAASVRFRRPRPSARLAEGVHALVVRPPRVRPFPV